MQIKKRYVVVAVLLLLGLTTFTFASPRQVEKQKSSKGISERVTNDKKENRSYAEALDAVEKAEENPTLETVETARNEIQNADDATVEQINQLEQRVEVVEETIEKIVEAIEEEVAAEEVTEEVDSVVVGYVDCRNKLNVRKGPAKNAEVLCEIPNASKVQVNLGKSTLEWYHVITSAGIEGFCMKNFVAVK